MKKQIRSLICALIAICPTFTVSNARANWETLEGVRIVKYPSNDGDSFRATHRNKEYIFRLYGADCAETDLSFPDRVAEQAREFGVTQEIALRGGHLASQRTAELLSSPFRVVTRWEDALGRSKMPRHYAYILPAGGGDLAANLLAEGLARSRGRAPVPPPGFPRVGTREEYDQLQNLAKSSRSGIWGETQRSQTGETSSPRFQNADSIFPSSQPNTDSRINLNFATPSQLESLPGIGPVLAQRIIQSRPHRGESDLLKVSGIGTSKLKKIRSMVSF